MNREEAEKFLLDGKMLKIGEITMIAMKMDVYSPVIVRLQGKKENGLSNKFKNETVSTDTDEIRKFAQEWLEVADTIDIFEGNKK
jgi:hypothetical protein